MPQLNLDDLREKAEAQIDFADVEREDASTLRFDTHTGTSIWAHASGTIEGSGRAHTLICAIAKEMMK